MRPRGTGNRGQVTGGTLAGVKTGGSGVGVVESRVEDGGGGSHRTVVGSVGGWVGGGLCHGSCSVPVGISGRGYQYDLEFSEGFNCQL